MSKRRMWVLGMAVVSLAALIYVVARPTDPALPGGDPDAIDGTRDLRSADPDASEGETVGLQGRAPMPGADPDGGALPPPVDLDSVDRERDLHGIVVRDDDSPVAGAQLEAIHYPWRYGRMLTDGQHNVSERRGSTRSARDGTFSLRLARGDHVHLRVTAEGLAPTELAMLQAGERLRIVLRKAVGLTVNVKSPTGDPAAGLELRIFNAGRRDIWFERFGETDASGTWTFGDLPPGRAIYLDTRARHEGWGDPSWIRLDLPDRGVLTHDLTLPEGRTLRGTVTDKATGEPIAGARVGMNWVMIPDTTTDADGRYVLPGWTGKGVSDIHVVAERYARARVDVEEQEVIDFALTAGARAAGRVVDGQGKPLERAQVMAVGSERGPEEKLSMDHAWTDADGRFTLEGLDPGLEHVLTVRKPGFAQGMSDIPVPGAKAQLDLGDIVMSAPRVLMGTLSDDMGAPVPRVAVNLVIIEPGKQGYRRGRAWERRTDDLGRFRFEDLPPAEYAISTRPTGGMGVSKRVQLLDRDEPTVVDLVQAVTREVRILVTAPDGKPLPGVYLRVQLSLGGAAPQGETNAEGYATLHLPPGGARVSASIAWNEPYAAPPALELGPNDTEGTIALAPAAITTGRLLDPDGEPLAWARLHALLPGDQNTITSTEEDGTFSIRTGRDAVMDIVFQGEVGPSRSRRHHTETQPMEAKVTGVRAGAKGLVIRSKRVRFDGKVVIRVLDPDGDPVEGLRINVHPLPPREGQRPRTDAEGRVRFEGLPVRELNLSVAFASTTERPWFAPLRQTFTPESQEIVVQLRTGARIEGVLQTAEGRPTPGYIVVLDGESFVGNAQAGADGRFLVVVDPDKPGPYTLQSMVHRQGSQPSAAKLEGVQPGVSNLVLRFAAEK